MKRTLSLLVLLLPAISYADGLEQDEQLNTVFGPSFSDYENYQPFTMEEHKTYFQVWKSRTRGFSDHYAINIAEIEDKTLETFKQTQDDSAKRNCIEQHNSNEHSTIVNGYETLSWTNVCQLEKMTVTSIQYTIMGDEKFYHLRKLWKMPVSEDKVTEWENLLAQTTVCNENSAEHACTAE